MEQQQVFDRGLHRVEHGDALVEPAAPELAFEGGMPVRTEGMAAGEAIPCDPLAEHYGGLGILLAQVLVVSPGSHCQAAR
jgi:hypothetical protein